MLSQPSLTTKKYHPSSLASPPDHLCNNSKQLIASMPSRSFGKSWLSKASRLADVALLHEKKRAIADDFDDFLQLVSETLIRSGIDLKS